MSGKSVATFQGKDIPFVAEDFSKAEPSKYYRHPNAKCKVMGMWVAYHDAYLDKDCEKQAMLHPETTGARILLIAGDEDEAWPSEYSVRLIEQRLRDSAYDKDHKMIIYPHGSHLNGLMPNRWCEKKLYRMRNVRRSYLIIGKTGSENACLIWIKNKVSKRI